MHYFAIEYALKSQMEGCLGKWGAGDKMKREGWEVTVRAMWDEIIVSVGLIAFAIFGVKVGCMAIGGGT